MNIDPKAGERNESAISVIVLLAQYLIPFTEADIIEYADNEQQPVPKPYSFAFTAGRFPGNIDRTRAEYGDSNGVVRGLYTYIDPRQQIRAVEYTADQEGFHPKLNIPPAIDTPAVAIAKSKHYQLYDEAQSGKHIYPSDTSVVAKAKENHLLLYEHIAKQHAKLAAEQDALNLKQQATEEYE